MRSPVTEILKAWYDLLNSNIIIETTAVPVYRVTVDDNTNTNYVYLSPQSFRDDESTNHSFDQYFDLALRIVTRQKPQINDSIADSIFNQIGALLYTETGNWNSCTIKETTNFQVVEIRNVSTNIIAEKDSTDRYFIYETILRHKLIER